MFTSVFPVHYVVPEIVMEMTSLTQPFQVIKPIVCFISIKMGSCQNYFAARLGMRLTINRTTLRAFRRTLAAIHTIIQYRAALDQAHN